jgi:SEFIR domain
MTAAATPPKAFISYSWSSQKHAEWVLQLARELVENGVNVVLDKWSLKEGHDAIEFMEKMVADADIKKVIVVLDQVYATKADSRTGALGLKLKSFQQKYTTRLIKISSWRFSPRRTRKGNHLCRFTTSRGYTSI